MDQFKHATIFLYFYLYAIGLFFLTVIGVIIKLSLTVDHSVPRTNSEFEANLTYKIRVFFSHWHWADYLLFLLVCLSVIMPIATHHYLRRNYLINMEKYEF